MSVELASAIRNYKTKKCFKFKMCANLKMANVWTLLVVTSSIALVSANVCSQLEKIMDCNQCFRCGGYWCNDPKEEVHCVEGTGDTWCSNNIEMAGTGQNIQTIGDLLEPNYIEKIVRTNKNSAVRISYKAASKPTVQIKILNTTQNNDFYMSQNTHCIKDQCTTEIEAYPQLEFCTATGGISESVYAKVSFGGLSEEAVLKYKVPCACACSAKVEEKSPMCNGHGKFTCGVCTCDNGWNGTYCSEPICEVKRGDVQCNNPNNNLECSGNGKCGPCDNCICYTDRVGSKYFDKNNYCADICMTVNDCDECLRDPKLGKCSHCPFSLFYQNFNETLVEERDEFNRSVWISCNETFPDGYHVEYVAMRDERYDTYFMIPPSDVEKAAIGGGGVNVTVPIAIIAALVVVAAGGFVVYKFFANRVPPVPLTDPMYTNIDAEDCTGENPLYKPPTSSFKNPTYGKW